MKVLFSPARILFYFLMILVFFFLGLYVAKLIGAGQGQMLAGGAIMLFYGFISSVIGLVVALLLSFRLSQSSIILNNKILGIVFILLVGFTVMLLMASGSNNNQLKKQPSKTTVPIQGEISVFER